MQLALCDDDIISLNDLTTLCQNFPSIKETRPFSDTKALFSAIHDGFSPDVVLMDIDLGNEKSGIDSAAELFALNPKIKIVYVTGYTDRFVQHIFLQPSTLVGFLQKPVQFDLLSAILQKVENIRNQERDSLICLSGKDLATAVPSSSIHYLESSGHRLSIHTDSDCYTIYERLEAVANRLPSDFYQCHKSFLVNMKHIRQIDKYQIYLKDGTVIPIAKSRYNGTKKRYFEYMRIGL